MKHIKKIILSILLVAFVGLGFFGAEGSVEAASSAPATVTFANGIDEITDPQYFVNGTSFYKKRTADGRFIYCMNWDRHIPFGQTLNLAGELDAGFAYLMENGFPNTRITGDETADYFITQVALWWYMDDTQGTNYLSAEYKSGQQNETWFQNIVDFKEAAKRNRTYATPSMGVSVDSSTLLYNKSEDNFVSKPVTVTTKHVAGDYSVSLEGAPAGTVITSTSGQAQNTFAQGSKFLVKVPASSMDSELVKTMKVTVSATGSINKAYKYAPADPGYYQNALPSVLAPETTPLSKTLNFKATATKVKVSKQDITNNKELAGATLVVRDKNGKVVDQWVSTNDVHYIYNLEEGTYTLTETIAPIGYALSKKTVTFKVLADGKIVSVTMTNTPTKVKIIKQDAATGKTLAGAKLVVKDNNGKEIDSWESTDKEHYLEKIPVGKYTLTEVSAPKGYVLAEKPVEFEVTNEEEIISVVMTNVPETPVPITASSMMTFVYIIGFIASIFGAGTIYYNVKVKQQ